MVTLTAEIPIMHSSACEHAMKQIRILKAIALSALVSLVSTIRSYQHSKPQGLCFEDFHLDRWTESMQSSGLEAR